jgi:nitric oxide reductase NorD protein
MPGPASTALSNALGRRPGLAATGDEALHALLRQGDVAAAERWAEAVLDLLHANAGVVCLTAFLRLEGSAAMLADVARDVAEVCRHAGAGAAVAAIAAWAPDHGADLWPGLCRLAREAPDCVPLAAGHAGRIMAAVGGQGFSAFVALGLRSAGRDKTRRAAFFALTDPAALRALAQGSGMGGGYGFATHERSLRLFATALWGRVPALRPLPVAAGRPPARRASLSDGVVLLPETFPSVPQPAQPRLFRATTAHALAHLMAGAPRQAVGPLKPMQLAVIGAVEDARVEALAMRRFPGLRRLWAPYHSAMPEGVTAPALLARLARALFDPGYADPHGFIVKARSLVAAADPLDPLESRRIGGLLGHDLGQMRVQFNARDYVVEPAYRDDGLGLWDFGEQPDAPPDIIEMMVEAARLRQEEGEGRPDQQPPREAATGAARAVVASPESLLLARYPEWDRHESVERLDWTAVRAIAAPMGDVRPLEDALEGLSDLRRRIGRLVRAATPCRPRRLKRQPDGMDLDLDAVVESEVARAAGEWPDARVFRTTMPQTRDLATIILLDVSASTRLGGVLETERIAVALLAEAMADLGDPFALLAFASDGREQVQLTRIKSFAEPFADAARARLAGLRSGLSTRLGAALRHAGAEIAGVRSFRRLVLVLTDGEPSDIDVPDPLDLVEDSRRAVFGLRAQGIDAFAVVLGAEGAETAARIFGRAGCVTVRRMDDLPTRLADLYFRLSRR